MNNFPFAWPQIRRNFEKFSHEDAVIHLNILSREKESTRTELNFFQRDQVLPFKVEEQMTGVKTIKIHWQRQKARF